MDINVTEAALWSENDFNQIVAYLENSGMTVFAEQARDFRAKGQDGYDEWQRIEAEAAKLPATELVRVGKGPHLLPENRDKDGQVKVPDPAPAPASTPTTTTKQQPQESSA